MRSLPLNRAAMLIAVSSRVVSAAVTGQPPRLGDPVGRAGAGVDELGPCSQCQFLVFVASGPFEFGVDRR